jgi:hypothetical protein
LFQGPIYTIYQALYIAKAMRVTSTTTKFMADRHKTYVIVLLARMLKQKGQYFLAFCSKDTPCKKWLQQGTVFYRVLCAFFYIENDAC